MILSLFSPVTTSHAFDGTPLGAPITSVIISSVPDDATTPTSDMNVTWRLLSDTETGGSPITTYTAIATLGGSTYTCTVNAVDSATTNTCKISGLAFATTYSFTVVTSNAIGSTNSTSISAKTPSKSQTLTWDNSSVINKKYGDSDFTLTATSKNQSNIATGLSVTYGTSDSNCSIDSSLGIRCAAGRVV